MDELSSKARSLVAAGRAGYRPSPGDRDRVAGALRAQLGATALPPSSPPPLEKSAHPITTALGSKSVLGLAIGLCLVGGGLFFMFRSSAPRTAPPAPTAASASEIAASAPSTIADSADALPVASAVAPPPLSSALPAMSSSKTDRLGQEVALLSRATSALRAGRAADALALLNEHQRKFPKGVLSEERRAAKAQALCSLGRQSEGRAELAHLTPRSPAAVRAQQACGNGNPG